MSEKSFPGGWHSRIAFVAVVLKMNELFKGKGLKSGNSKERMWNVRKVHKPNYTKGAHEMGGGQQVLCRRRLISSKSFTLLTVRTTTSKSLSYGINFSVYWILISIQPKTVIFPIFYKIFSWLLFPCQLPCFFLCSLLQQNYEIGLYSLSQLFFTCLLSITPLKSISVNDDFHVAESSIQFAFFFCLFFWGNRRLWHHLSLPPHWNNLFPWLLHFSGFPLTSMAAPSQISLLFAPHQHGLLMLECFRAHSSNFFSVHILSDLILSESFLKAKRAYSGDPKTWFIVGVQRRN